MPIADVEDRSSFHHVGNIFLLHFAGRDIFKVSNAFSRGSNFDPSSSAKVSIFVPKSLILTTVFQ